VDKIAIRFQPLRAEIAVERGLSVLQAAMGGKVPLTHKCGGHGSCGTCKVVVESRFELPGPTTQELRHLAEDRLQGGFRLACQCLLMAPATVTIPEDPLRRVVRELLEADKSRRQQERTAGQGDALSAIAGGR
jgi:2Fe-2S ferredoxin